ncbi:hypothetical protein Y888_18965 [Mixta calida B021323]|nr:hypothetical protein Y888_18965 [Mixta calida B021323]
MEKYPYQGILLSVLLQHAFFMLSFYWIITASHKKN